MTPRDPDTAAHPRELAAARLLAALGRDCAAEERLLEAPAFETLARAAEGRLNADEQALWQERCARDPQLAARAQALSDFRTAAYGAVEAPVAGGGKLVAFAPRGARRVAGPPIWGWLATAAALLIAVGGSFIASRPSASPALEAIQEPAPASSPQELFGDDFEHGDVSSWSSISSSG